MRMHQLRPALVLSAWTVLVWTTRIRNIWTDESSSVGGQVFRTALALVFTGFAVVVTGAWFQARRRGAIRRSVAPWIRAFAIWTTAVWVVRGVQIASADHGMAFVAVHTALAVVSIVLAVWAFRSVAVDEAAGEPVSV